MERARRRCPAPALVIACLALFVALGGTVLAATKINGHAIRVKSMPGNRLVVGSLPGNRIAPGSLTGAQIKVSTLGPVPNADHADSAETARHAQTAIAADHAADATTINGRAVGCGAGQMEFAGACWEVNLRASPLDPTDAAVACGRAGGELPEPLTLIAFNQLRGVNPNAGGELTNAIRGESEGFWGAVIVEGDKLRLDQPTALHQYRCVMPLLS